MTHHLFGTDDEGRAQRLAAAVKLVEGGDSRGQKVSVRRAAAMYNVPKSTVHRHIQQGRGTEPPRRPRSGAAAAASSSRRAKASGSQQHAGSHKLRIGFLVNQDSGAQPAAPARSHPHYASHR